MDEEISTLTEDIRAFADWKILGPALQVIV